MQAISQDEPLNRDIAALNRMTLEMIARYSSASPEDVCQKLNISQTFMREVQKLSYESIATISNVGQFILQPAIDASALEQMTNVNSEQAKAHVRSVTRLNEPLNRDIAALNRMTLEMIARYSTASPEDVCLKLNISQTFMREVQKLSYESIATISNLGQFILQPAIDASALEQLTNVNSEQAKAHMRSVTRLNRST